MDEKLINIHKELREKDKIPVITIDQILARKFSAESYLIEKLVPNQSITAITGAPGSFKTWLTLEIAKCVSQELTFLGQFKTTKANVLFIDKENHFRYIQERLKKLGMENLPIFYFSKPDDFYIDKEKDYKNLMKLIKSLKIKLVIFDSLVRIHSGDENNSKDISKVMSAFRKITSEGATVIFVHHNRKEGFKTQSTTNSIRGSSDIYAGVDCLLQVTKPQKENFLGINQSKLRIDKEIDPFKVDICSNEENSLMELIYSGSYNSNESELKEIQENILVIFKEKDEVSRKEFIDMFSDDYSIPVIDNALKQLIKSEIIEIRKGTSGKNFYSLKNKPVKL